MKNEFQSKLPNVGTTIFTVMSQLAADVGAINLSQGFPGFEPPAALTDRIRWHLEHGGNQYAPMPGIAALREVIAEKYRRLQGHEPDPETEITVCTGATEGLFSAIAACVSSGDEVVVLDPAYDAYEPAVALAGGIVRHVALRIDDESGDFVPDWQQVRDAINAKTRLLILNFPHNPTGAILSGDDLDTLAEILRDTRCLLLSDEVYEHIVFDGARHRSLLSHDELRERAFVVSSFGKTVHATGWKVGWCVAPRMLTAEFRKVHQFTTFAVSTPMQLGLADFFNENAGWYEALPAFYEQKRDHFCRQLAASRFRLRPARSTFFQILDYGDITGEPDTELARRWTHDVGVASIPLSVFCQPAFTGTRLRFCFAKDDATLTEAAARLSSL